MKNERIKALFKDAVARLDRQGAGAQKSHGMVWPAGLPACTSCGKDPNDPVHVAPMSELQHSATTMMMGLQKQVAGDKNARKPMMQHVYAVGYTGFAHSIPCQHCGMPATAQIHPAGTPSGAGTSGALKGGNPASSTGGIGSKPAPQQAAAKTTTTSTPQGPTQINQDNGTGAGPKEGYGQIVLVRHDFKPLPGTNSVDKAYELCAKCGFSADDEVHQNVDDDALPNLVTVKKLQAAAYAGTGVANGDGSAALAFVTKAADGHIVITGPASTFADGSELPRELASTWQDRAVSNPHFQWIEGRFVEADTPNRNKAMWSTQDLEMGSPSVAHGPVNWLHEEKHIIGSIADAKMVHSDRQVAGHGNHIRAIAALWPYIYPFEARQVAQASDENKLWYSMECISREVACTQCDHVQSYADYMQRPAARCGHIRQGAAMRFTEPSFLGGAVILGGVRPGWSGANATVMKQAAKMADRQAASFDGLTSSEAEQMVAQILTYANGATS